MADKKETTEKNYIKQYVGESGYTYDATKIRNQLAKEAYQRYTEQDDKELQQYAEEKYISAIYPNETNEYLVETAILTCTMATTDATTDSKIYKGKKYSVTAPSKGTGLIVTENKDASCSGGLYYATVKDSKKNDNVPPFRCNCILAPYTDEEWDNLPRVDGNAQQVNDILIINMGSILFCRHGGIISAVTSGQNFSLYGNVGFWDSTVALLMKYEGNVGVRVNNNGTLTVGYGYDFTKESDPETFNKYFYIDEYGNIQKKRELGQDEALNTIYLAVEKKNIITILDEFINGTGAGNEEKPLEFNQNQYNALFSFFYSNGPYVFTDGKYEEWISEGGEKANRAEARKNLKEYLIEKNGNYDAIMIEKLFVDCKGANIKYEYESRRKEEAKLFMSE